MASRGFFGGVVTDSDIMMIGMAKQKKEYKVFFLCLFLFLGILFWPVIQGKIPFPGDVLIGHYHPWADIVWEGRGAGYPIKNFIVDPLFQSYPWRKLSLEQIFSGRWPLWNPYNILGMPLLGVSLSAPFYPFNLFFLAGNNFGWTILVIFTPVVAGFCLFLWLRNLKIGFLPSMFSSFIWAFSGLLMDKVENVVDNHSFIWLPLGLLAVDKLNEGKNTKWLWAIAAAVILNWLAGYPPQFLVADIVLLLWAVFRLFKLKRIFFHFLIIFVLAHLVLTFFWLPTLELSLSSRGNSSFMEGEPYFLPWHNLILILAPRFFGAPSSLNSWLPSSYPGEKLWLGMAALIFSLVGITRLKRDKSVRFWSAAVVFSALLFLPTPIGEGFKALNLPFISSVTPMKLAWVFDLGLVFLAAKGAESWLTGAKKKSLAVKMIILSLGLIIIGLWILGWCYPSYLSVKLPNIVSSVNRARAVAFRNLVLPTAFFGITSFIVLAGMSLKDKWRKIGLFVLIIISLAELTREASYYLNFIPASLVYPETKIIKFLKDNGRLWRTMVTDPQILPVNTNIFYKIPMLNGYSSLYPYRNGQLIKMNEFELQSGLSGYKRTVFQTDLENPLIDLLGARYVLSLDPIDRKGFTFLMNEGKTYLYENEGALPKAWFAKKWSMAEGDREVAKKLLGIDRSAEVVLEEKIPLPENFQPLSGKVTIKSYLESRVELQTENKNPGLLLLNDAYFPGWKAFVDGIETKIYRADFNLRAIAVSEGEHKITFFYQPFSFKLGLLISLGSLGVILLFFFFFGKKENIAFILAFLVLKF